MEQFFILKRSFIPEEDLWIGEWQAPPGFVADYLPGKRYSFSDDDVFRLFVFVDETEKNYRRCDYLEGNLSIPVISNDFKEILMNLDGECYQFCPSELLFEITGAKDSNYWFLNILESVPCFDWEQSKYTLFDIEGVKAVEEVHELKIKSEVLGERDMVRIDELPALILVSQRLKDLIIANNLVGIAFIEIDQYKDP